MTAHTKPCLHTAQQSIVILVIETAGFEVD